MSAHLRQSVKFLLVNVKPIFLNVAKQFGAFTFWVGYQHNASFYVDDIIVTNGITDIVPSEYRIDCVRYPDYFLLTPVYRQANVILCNFMLPLVYWNSHPLQHHMGWHLFFCFWQIDF